MARTLLGTQQPGATQLSGSAGPTLQLSSASIEARMRQKRSPQYLDAIKKLDAGSHLCSPHEVDALLDAIRAELPEIMIDLLPIGLVAKCYLGHPYEVHTVERTGHIIRHYKSFESLPGLLEGARDLARHPGYAFIEVYTDKLIAVSASGDTSIVKGKKG